MVGLPQHRRLRGRLHEGLPLLAKRLELTQDPGHEVRRDEEDGDVEDDAGCFHREAIRLGAVRSDRDVRGREERARDDRPAGAEAEATGDDEQRDDDVGGPLGIRREDEERIRDDPEVDREHEADDPREHRAPALGVKDPRDGAGVRGHERPQTEDVADADIREGRSEEERQRRASQARPVEGALEAFHELPRLPPARSRRSRGARK